jgi:DNA polymerase elongation subunit (family B)
MNIEDLYYMDLTKLSDDELLDLSKNVNIKANSECHQAGMEYNIHDVDLIDQLEAKLKLIEMVFAIAYDAKVNFEDALTSVLLWDVIIHNYLLSFNTVVKPQENNIPEHAIVGGYVKDPHVGLTKWPVSFDLTSLYPHLMIQYQISPENYVKKMEFDIDEFLAIYDAGFLDSTDERLRNTHTFKSLQYAHEHNLSLTANGGLYRREDGFLPNLMDRMFKERNEYKNLMMDAKKEYAQTKAPELLNTISKYNNLQQTRKVNLNSAYGSLANKYFRWFSTAVAESITTSGQLSIRWIEMKLNRYLNKLLGTTDIDYVVAIDTDSVYIRLDCVVEKFFPGKDTKKTVALLDKICQEKLQPFITKSYEELATLMNARENKMFMKRENIANKAIWIAKKRYIMNVYDSEGVSYEEPELKMMGIEAIRSSTPGIVRSAIKNSLSIIMNEDEKTLQQYVIDFEKQFFASPFELVAFPRGVSDLEKYADKEKIFGFKTPVHVKGSLFFNYLLEKMKLNDKYERISSGDKIKFCYLKEPNIYRTPVISCGPVIPEELDLKRHIDYHTQFEKAYLSPLSNITDAIGWQLVDRPSLMNFFED